MTSTAGAKTIGLSIRTNVNDGVDKFAVWALYGDAWKFVIEPTATNAANATTMSLPRASADGRNLIRVVVSAIDRVGNESARTAINADELASVK